MGLLPSLKGDYDGAARFESGWRELASAVGARESVAGHSVEGRPLYRFDFGTPGQPVVLLTALIHGLEVIGSVSLFHILDSLLRKNRRTRDLMDAFHVVVVPVVNPDAFHRNMDRLSRGWPATRRTNANGVDLNRNFPAPMGDRPRHPFSGSTMRLSPHYRGTHPFSEPETQVLRDVVAEVRPTVSVGFHSFGNLLLYPWGFSKQPNRRARQYRRLGLPFVRGTRRIPYRIKQASHFYPTVGDLDDWLDAEHGALALTVEVGGLDRRLWNPLRLINPFCWMNPLRIESTVRNLVPAARNLLEASVGLKLPRALPAR